MTESVTRSARALPLTQPRGLSSCIGLNASRGNEPLRLLHRVINRLLPWDRDPSHELLAPGDRSAHSVADVTIPIGEHHTHGHLFVPHRANGATICFVHGTGAVGVLPYYFFLRAYLEAGFRVLFFELDGHGRNPRPLWFPGIDENVPAALEALRRMPGIDSDRVGLAGVSLGGACALHAASRNGGVRAVALVATPHTLELGPFELLKETAGTLTPEVLPIVLKASPNRLLEFLTLPIRVGQKSASVSELDLLDDRAIPLFREVIRKLDVKASAARIKDAAVIVVNGAWDQQAPARQAEEIHALVQAPKALHIEPRRNHFTVMGAARAVRATVDWFKRWL
jgi:pimeloyl-ACP methyl ester carboxylesterase